MENKINNIKNHLEFLGYSTEPSTNEKGNRFLNAKSQGKPTLAIWYGRAEDSPQYILLTSSWNGVKKVNTIEQFIYLNKINANLMVNKVFIDFTDDTLNFRSNYTADYDKKAFGDFLDLFLDGIRQSMAGEEFNKLFLEEKK